MTAPTVEMSEFARTIFKHKYSLDGKEEWEDTARRVVEHVMGPYFPDEVEEMVQAITDRKFMPGGRYLYAAGKTFHQTQNCLLLDVEDSRESIADLMQRVTNGLMTGAGIGIVWSKLRANGALVKGMGGTSTGPLAFMQMVNETGRHIMQGGSRRAAIWAGLHWNHPDVFDFIKIKDYDQETKDRKEKDFNAVAPLDGTNVSVILDDDFFTAYRDKDNPMHDWALHVYWSTVESMLANGEPGFSVDVGENAGEHLRNACTEVTSRDNDDICNLGSLNMARIETKEEFARLTKLGTHFLLSGTLYSKTPYEGVAKTREKNRRLGLGIMGVYEWLLTRGYRYGPNEELGTWLDEYTRSTEYAWEAADLLGISRPVKTRAIAPTGTIGILAETTTSGEPLFAAAFKRRYLKGNTWHFQYVIDQSAKRLMDQGVDPSLIEDAYDLAEDFERRIEFQSWLQRYVDHGVSSTINLPAKDKQSFTSEEFGETLMTYLPTIRGITVYPDGARGGQPITKVPLDEALGFDGYEYEEYGNENACVGGVCGV